jgi:hypothetical protein
MRKKYTVIDFLVVIGMLVILAITVFTLNSSGLLQEARDNIRIFNMATLNSAVSYSLGYSPSESLGSANIVYISLTDPLATSTVGDQCQGLGLAALPLGYSWHCAASSTYGRTDGTGWIPVNFSEGFLVLLPVLPFDPINTSSSQHYYTYTTHGRHYEVTSVMESAKYQSGGSEEVVSADSGVMSTLYENESRTRVGLEPFDYSDPSLIGLWALNTGLDYSVTYDYSENNGTAVWWETGLAQILWEGGWKTTSSFAISEGAWSLSFWVNPFFNLQGTITRVRINGAGALDQGVGSHNQLDAFGPGATSSLKAYNGDYYAPAHSSFETGVWYFVTEVENGDTSTLYINGLQDSSASAKYGRLLPAGAAGSFLSGLIDDVHIYNSALSAAEVQAAYRLER